MAGVYPDEKRSEVHGIGGLIRSAIALFHFHKESL